MNSLVVVLLLAVTSLSVTTTAFVVAPTTPKQHARRSTTTTSYMVPRYDPTTQRWSPSDNDESAKANYPPIRSLLRHGPKAFLLRTIQPDQYDQAVLKFMAKENCGRWVAQGNMDRFFENAQDWAFERLEAQRTGREMDYVTLDKKQVVLSSVWAGIVFWFANSFFTKYAGSGFIQL